MKFDITKYESKLKEITLNIGRLLIDSSYFEYTELNEGILMSVDFIPSNGQLYVIELNTALLLSDMMVYNQAGFDFEKLCSFLNTTGYKKVVLVERTEEKNLVPYPEWVDEMNKVCKRFDIEFSCEYYSARTGNGFNKDITLSRWRSDARVRENSIFYIKNLPIHTRKSKSGIIYLSRNKDKFREFLHSHNLEHLMPPFKEKIKSKDVVVKVPNEDNGFGIEFTDKNEGEYVEEFIQHDVDDLNNPIICKGLALLSKKGLVWLRPQDSNFSMPQSPGFKNKTLEREGIFGQYDKDTLVYLEDGSEKPISEIKVNDRVVSPVIGPVGGKMYVEWLNNDTLLDGFNETWRDIGFYSLDDLQYKPNFSTVSGVSKINFKKWIVINNSFKISLCEYLLVERNNIYSFIKTNSLKVGDKIINKDKKSLLVEELSIKSGNKTFYGFSCYENDTIATNLGITILTHHFNSY